MFFCFFFSDENETMNLWAQKCLSEWFHTGCFSSAHDVLVEFISSQSPCETSQHTCYSQDHGPRGDSCLWHLMSAVGLPPWLNRWVFNGGGSDEERCLCSWSGFKETGRRADRDLKFHTTQKHTFAFHVAL